MSATAHPIDIVNRIVDAIKVVTGSGPVALHEPSFEGNEWNYLQECLESNYVSSRGKFVDQFESAISEYTGAKHVVSVVNGTAALQVALKLAGVKSGDEVLIPALTFVATANAVSYLGAIPHFVDSDVRTLGIDVEKLRSYLYETTEMEFGLCINNSTKRVIRALVPMHAFGHPSDMEGLLSVSKEFNLQLVEDAAESLGSFYNGQHTGTLGLVGTLSFNGNKTITTGGGGAILTNNDLIAARARHLTTTAKVPHKWEFNHDDIGYNFRMPNINAALGCAQLEQLSEKVNLKRKLFYRYQDAFKSITEITLFSEPPNCYSNYWLQTLLLDENCAEIRDKVLHEADKNQIFLRPAWKPLSELIPYRQAPRMDLSTTESLSMRIINLPSSDFLA